MANPTAMPKAKIVGKKPPTSGKGTPPLHNPNKRPGGSKMVDTGFKTSRPPHVSGAWAHIIGKKIVPSKHGKIAK